MSSEAILSIHSASRPAPVPLIDLVEQHATIRDEVRDAVDAVFSSQRFILGEEVAALEQEIAAYCDARHAIGCASGTDALVLALMALDVGPGDEVITSPFTFFATASAIHRVGAKPVFTDIDPATFNIDHNAVAAAITPRTKAIMPVHLFGQCANMEPLWRLAVRHGLAIVEDAAQAIGATYRGRHAGVLGTIACFSFFPTKNLGGAGDGGMLSTDDKDLDVRLRRLRVHGDVGRYEHLEVGLNSRLDALQATVLRIKLRHLESWTQGRCENAARYQEQLAASGIDAHVELPQETAGNRHVFNQYCIRVREGRRDAVLSSLQSKQIGCAVYYPKPLHLQPCFAFLGHRLGEFPESEAAAGEVLALPIYAELGEARQERVITGLVDAVKQASRRTITIPFRDAGRKAA
jgi:dTDP-4-amino-4,6-dideoxygalactose transaminase